MSLQSSWQTIWSSVEVRGLWMESRAPGDWKSEKIEAAVVLHDFTVYFRAFQKL